MNSSRGPKRAAVAFAGLLALLAAGCGLGGSTGASTPAATGGTPTYSGHGQWTGLQWHDVSATAGSFFQHRAMPYGWTRFTESAQIVRWSGGFALAGGAHRAVWTSRDGLVWHEALGAPEYAGLASWNGLLLAGGFKGESYGLWSSSDGIDWRKAPIAFDSYGCQHTGVCDGLAVGRPGIMAVTVDNRVTIVNPATPHLSTDGVTWTPAPLPDEATDVKVAPFFDGFIALGMVARSPDDVATRVEATWVSPDGLHWSRYQPAVPSPLLGVGYWHEIPIWALQSGPKGMDNGTVRSSEGVTWTADSESPEGQWMSDGDRILVARTWVSRFLLSEGDGRWMELEQGGDVGQLPGGGHAFLLPNGLLWVTQDQVFFGEALSGVHPGGSLAPVTPTPTPWPGPS